LPPGSPPAGCGRPARSLRGEDAFDERLECGDQPLEAEAAHLAAVEERVGGERGEEELGHELPVGVGVGLAHQQADMEAEEPVGPGLEARPRVALGRGHQVGVLLEQPELRAAECLDALLRGGAGTERRRPADRVLLELSRVLLEQRERESGAVTEAAEERALADAGGGGDRIHRDVLDAALGEQPAGRAEHFLAVALRVGADLCLGVRDGEYERHRRCIGKPCHGGEYGSGTSLFPGGFPYLCDLADGREERGDDGRIELRAGAPAGADRP
jgi:hypothetical protein